MAVEYGPRLIHKYLVNTTGGIEANVFTTGGTGTGASTGLPRGGIMQAGPPAGERWSVSRMIVNIDGGASVTSTKYGNISSFTHGLLVYVKNSTGIMYYLGGTTQATVKSNFDWSRFCYDVVPMQFSAKQPVTIRWSFFKSGADVLLFGGQGQKLVVQFQDGTTGLGGHTFQIQGHAHNTHGE